MGYSVRWCCCLLGFLCLCIGTPAPLFLIPPLAEFLSFYVSLVLKPHQAGYSKPLFHPPEVVLQLMFVVPPLPTTPGLFSEGLPVHQNHYHCCTGAHTEPAREWGELWA